MRISTQHENLDWCQTAAYEAACAAPLCDRLRKALEAGEGKELVDAAFAMSWVFANHLRQNQAEDKRLRNLSDAEFESELRAARSDEQDTEAENATKALIARVKGVEDDRISDS